MSVEGTRFAHSEGRVSLVYSRNGKKIHTLGMDGELRVWSGIDDDDCENIVVGEEGFAVAVATNRYMVHTIRVADPDPYWIRIHWVTGSVFGIWIRIQVFNMT